MPVSKFVGRGLIALALAGAPLAGIAPGISDIAFAKGGNGNGGGNGGGSGGGSGGGHGKSGNHGNSGSHAKARSDSGRSGGERAGTPRFLQDLFKHGRKSERAATGKSGKVVKARATKTAVPTPKPKNSQAEAAKLSSLGRNYHAYLNSNDPRMAAISAYAIAYAEFEAEFGSDVIPTDPALSDEALREAIASFTNGGEVTDATLEDVKETLGVGTPVGKIDDIREHLLDTTPDEDIALEN
ncbi:hypothetical protein CN172_28670 [Sinorhizobium meliloti]|uniref:hypothetical protein n=1 Tax=Rhizobium meliloti TaxID=382 RepID=UPI000FD757F8|nr:hypothetical protein [Sinorhizobium meliloti]RVE94278.1 hypothetical protein CN232_28360 [Sinorhizobium meliloti]RVH38341.1 hypothetical protein CN208_29380 [Sinorhizobium meliloti]RVK06462.1 hypothetical protein CN172_28670 [Sinorhizobium meliloti]